MGSEFNTLTLVCGDPLGTALGAEKGQEHFYRKLH